MNIGEGSVNCPREPGIGETMKMNRDGLFTAEAAVRRVCAIMFGDRPDDGPVPEVKSVKDEVALQQRVITDILGMLKEIEDTLTN